MIAKNSHSRTPSPPPIRSYQRDLLRYMAEAQADSMSVQSHEVVFEEEKIKMKFLFKNPLVERNHFNPIF